MAQRNFATTRCVLPFLLSIMLPTKQNDVLNPGILKKIFTFVFFRSVPLRDIFHSSFHPLYALVPLLRVCKTWNAVAREVLYATISLGFENRNGEKALRKLCAVLEDNPHLGLLVREIYLTTKLTKKEAANQIKLLGLCPNVQKLYILGWNGYFLRDFHAVIKEKRFLKELRLSRYNFQDTECDSFCTLDQLLVILQHLPDIETVIHYDEHPCVDGLEWEAGSEEIEEPVKSWWDEDQDYDPKTDRFYAERVKLLKEDREKRILRMATRTAVLHPRPNACPNFKRLQWRGWFDHIPCRCLSLIAPNLEYLEPFQFRLEPKTHGDPKKALERWGASLRVLTLFPSLPGSDYPGPLITNGLAAKMTRLVTLQTNANTFKTNGEDESFYLGILASFPVLSELHFHAGTDSQVRALKSVVSKLVSLTSVILSWTQAAEPKSDDGLWRPRNLKKFSPGAVAELKEECLRYGISMREMDIPMYKYAIAEDWERVEAAGEERSYHLNEDDDYEKDEDDEDDEDEDEQPMVVDDSDPGDQDDYDDDSDELPALG
ncbi:hypothetical protein D9758_007374 [Tetrapyrgos nigripes]|uniref:F-box domain-containing protein n=1 Tax=Tetrapyrgos nigripes TaxID=182062 RepID=A0A8H5GAT2_9AGAR|nr:hypothetical protein D9758_007374 [Tetrapyrgos nigripes]